MAQITFNIDDAHINRVLDALGELFGYTPADGPKGTFVREKLAVHIMKMVRTQEQDAAEEAAAAAITNTDITAA